MYDPNLPLDRQSIDDINTENIDENDNQACG